MRILHVGCGRKKLGAAALLASVGLQLTLPETHEVIHLDADARLEPDLVHTLGVGPLRLADDSIDVIIAWHVLEHVGQQGKTLVWFDAWREFYRVLKPGGFLYGESPYYTSIWAWSDPTHSRAISEHAFAFFNQENYRITPSAISPYRVRCDFRWLGMAGMERGFRVITDPNDTRIQSLRFALKAQKPFVGWWESAATEESR